MSHDVSTQAELDAAIQKQDGEDIRCVSGEFRLSVSVGRPRFIIFAGVKFFLVARESSQPHVVAWESSQPHVEARESSQPHVVARESSQPHVVAWESSQPHVVARESSQPHVVARGSSQPHVVAWESSQPHVVASGFVQLALLGAIVAKVTAKVAVQIRGTKAKVTGGKQTRVVVNTPKQWCDYYGVTVKRGVAILFKGVDADYSTDRARNVGLTYAPGSTPEAKDWDGAERECGGGLHFSPAPAMTREFNEQAKHYMACPVKLADIVVHPDGQYPQKVKAKRVCAPTYEVDIKGNRLAAEAVKS